MSVTIRGFYIATLKHLAVKTLYSRWISHNLSEAKEMDGSCELVQKFNRGTSANVYSIVMGRFGKEG